jgi:hypothetical protein
MQHKLIDLIALYTSKLPAELQVQTYATFLKDVTQTGERRASLLQAERANLDVDSITKTVVHLIKSQPSPQVKQL